MPSCSFWLFLGLNLALKTLRKYFTVSTYLQNVCPTMVFKRKNSFHAHPYSETMPPTHEDLRTHCLFYQIPPHQFLGMGGGWISASFRSVPRPILRRKSVAPPPTRRRHKTLTSHSPTAQNSCRAIVVVLMDQTGICPGDDSTYGHSCCG